MMANEDSAPPIESAFEPEIHAPAPEELVNKILELRAKGDAKNNPKKPKTTANPRPSRPIADGSPTKSSAPGIKTKAAIESAIEIENATETDSDSDSHKKSPESAPPGDGKLEELVASVATLTELISGVEEKFEAQNSARDHAFDLLYEEMSGYKNDFFYERLKPTLRSLLFLLDSIEEFEREVEAHDKEGAATPREIIQANLAHFRDQLTDTLLMSEVAPIEAQNEQFDAKTQRAVQVVKVEAEQHNTVQKQIRGGWTLGGKMLRAADVVVGRSDESHKK